MCMEILGAEEEGAVYFIQYMSEWCCLSHLFIRCFCRIKFYKATVVLHLGIV